MLLSLTDPFASVPDKLAPLHAPDGFFSLPVIIAGWVISALVIGYAVRRTGQSLNERVIPMMGVMAAFVFAAQMLNFPVAGGTSGHLIGGALAAIILGPWAAVLIMASVVALQALLFQDGGLVAMGINLLNMAVISSLLGYAVWWSVKQLGSTFGHLLGGGFAAAWISVVVSAVAAAVELGISGTSPLMVALPAMALVHALIGIGEGLITVGALSFIRSARPSLLPSYS